MNETWPLKNWINDCLHNEADDPNIAMLLLAANGFGTLLDEVVFLGGCAAGLLITDNAAPPTRETKDVDVIVEIVSRYDYYKLSEKLLNMDEFHDALPCHLPPDSASQLRAGTILQRMDAIQKLKPNITVQDINY